MSVGLDSVATVEFTNAISEELRTSVSAILLFDHPTLDSIASYLAAELEVGTVEDVPAASVGERGAGTIPGSTPASRQVHCYFAALCVQVAGSTSSVSALRSLVSQTHTTPSTIPLARWEAPSSDV